MINARIITHPIGRVAMQDPTRLTGVRGWEGLMDEDIIKEAQKLEKFQKDF